ncbi:MAG: STAS domain-containing protein, partial [Myxococcales bacterium]|nr:STAS domain-containing protein [Myxococcales bacterium]
IYAHIGSTQAIPLLLTVGGVAVLASCKRWLPKAPGALIVLVITTTLTWMADLTHHGVAVVGNVPSGLPPVYNVGRLFSQPRWEVVSIAGLIALLSFLEAIAVSERFGREKGRDVEHNLELVGIGLANIGSGLMSGMPLSGALSRSAVQAGAGATTSLTNIFSGLVTVATLLLLTPVFANVPRAALAAIVLTAVVGLFDIEQAVKLWRFRKLDFGVLLLTFSAVLVLGIERGVVIGITTSLGIFVLRTARPNIVVLGKLVADPPIYHELDRYHEVKELPGILVVRIDAAFYFANASYLVRELRRLEREREESGDRVWAIVIDASGINHIDSVGEHGLRQLLSRFSEREALFYIAHLKGEVYDVLEASGFLDEIGREHLALNTEDAVQRALDKRKGGAGRGDLGVDVHAVHRGRDSQTSVPAVAENDDEDKSAS